MFNKHNVCTLRNNVGVNKAGITIRDANITGPASAVFDIHNDHFTIENTYFYNCAQAIRLFNCNYIKILNCHFNTVSYSIITQQGYSSNHVLVDGCTCENAVADFVEANSANVECDDWIITNNIFLGSKSWPEYKTEERFVGITRVSNVVISNNIVHNVSGDAAIHVEATGSFCIISNNIFNDINPSAKCIYTMGSNTWRYLVDGNTFRYNGDGSPVAWFASNVGSMNIFQNNYLEGNWKPVYFDDTGSNFVKNNIFCWTQGIDLNRVYGIVIEGNIFYGMRSAIGTQQGTAW